MVCLFVALSATAQVPRLQRSNTLVVPEKGVTPNLALSQDALKDSLLKEVSHYPFIFEGTIREIYHFEDDKHEIWTSTLIQIHKSFKANLQSGTVEVMTKNIDIFADKHSPSQLLPRKPVQIDTTSDMPGQIGTSYMYFVDTLCYLPIIKVKRRDDFNGGRPRDIAISRDTTASPTPKAIFGDKTTNRVKYSCYAHKIRYIIGYDIQEIDNYNDLGITSFSDKKSKGYKVVFKDAAEIYNFINKIEGTQLIDFTKKQFKKTDYKEWQRQRYLKEKTNKQKGEGILKKNPKTNNQEKQVILDRLNSINSTEKKNLKTDSDNNLTYFFENESYITEGDNVFLEFDVYVQANNAETFLDNATLVFRYSNTAFGNSIDNNNNVEISRGTAINSTADYANPFSYDIDANHFKVVVSVAPTVTNRFQLSNSPVQLCHLRLRKAECSVNSDLYFENLLTTQNTNHAIYTETEDEPYSGGTYYAYNNIDYSDMSLQHQMCKPEITEVTSDDTNYPDAVPAGCGKRLIIKGRFFGNEKGSIRFHNTSNNLAVLAGDSFLWLDNFDMNTCNWTNNEISVVLPYQSIDVYELSGVDYRAFFELHSDVFKIITSFSSFSDDKFLNIPYNLFNKCVQDTGDPVIATAKHRYKLVANDAVHNTMNFRLHTNLFQSEEVMSAIYHALDKWQCTTGLQYRITENFEDDINASFVANEENNNISSIFFYEDLGSIGLASSYGDICGDAMEIDEVDILIDINGDPLGSWEQVLLHELGHAHGLAHTLPDVTDNLEDLMQPGPYQTQSVTEIGGDDLQGALNVVNYSTENTV